MTPDRVTGRTEELTFRHFSGEPALNVATIYGDESRIGDFLTAREVRLDDGTGLSQVRLAPGAHRDTAYERLDNEILAGRRLHNVARSVDYPAAVSFLYGDEAESAEPYALLRPYRGKPLSTVVSQMLEDEQRAFEVSLLTGICWLAAAGVAHRALSPSTVRWDSHEQQVQITDFSLCTVFSAPRKVTGSRETTPGRPRSDGKGGGLVTDRDDMYTVALLIYYVRAQGDDSRPSPGKLADMGLANLEPLLGPPEGRPTASELLASHLGEANPVPRWAGGSAHLADGYSSFNFWWEKKSPGRTFPVDPRGIRAAPPSSPAPPPSPPPLPAEPTGPTLTTPGRSRAPVTWGRRRGRR
jgi:serine/threonine protein kinase